MAEPSSPCVMLPNMIRHRTPKDHASILAVSIANEDLSYIQEFLASETRMQEIRGLSLANKERLVALLAEFLDAPLRAEAMEMIYALLGDVGHVDALSKRLVARSADFAKLVYLKGKMDYLLHLSRAEPAGRAENEYEEGAARAEGEEGA